MRRMSRSSICGLNTSFPIRQMDPSAGGAVRGAFYGITRSFRGSYSRKALC